MSRFWWCLAVLFAGRLAFGLASEFWSEDETQIYLMGLGYFATGRWPYFGPDVVWTQSAIAGALQPLLVGLPLRLAPVPEAPFVLLNVLSFASLAALAWYICRRFPTLPAWLVWGWVLTAPWTLQFSTHVNNPSYVLPAAIPFFIGFFESMPPLALGVLPARAAVFMMGAALTWIMQIHMSWPLLLPYAALAVVMQSRPRSQRLVGGWFLLGAALPATLLVPTFLRYGLGGGSAGALANLHIHLVPPDRLVETLAQFFSFASLEINRFVANDNAKRVMLLADHLWIIPIAAVVLVAGLAQPVWMLVTLFRRGAGRPDWSPLRIVTVATVVLVYASYFFVTEAPQAHAFYVVAPIAFIYAAACWSLIDSPRWRRFAGAVLACNVAFHAVLAAIQGPEQSLYANRDVVASAIREQEPEIFGHRRPYAIDAGPRALSDPAHPYTSEDLTVDEQTLRVGPRRSAIWTVTITNRNPGVAFRNLIYVSTYTGGGQTQRHEDVIKDVLQPGETARLRLVDTTLRMSPEAATFTIAGAEALLPARRVD
jgi:hypothetical protein